LAEERIFEAKINVNNSAPGKIRRMDMSAAFLAHIKMIRT
jgi:hypothetical protein